MPERELFEKSDSFCVAFLKSIKGEKLDRAKHILSTEIVILEHLFQFQVMISTIS